MKVGYRRTSKLNQNYSFEHQLDVLEKTGCDRIFSEQVTGRKVRRPEFMAMLDYVREGDTVVCSTIDRLGRTFYEMVLTMMDLEKKGINIIAADQGLDTSTSMGKITAKMLLFFADVEVVFAQERTKKT